ncbi:MAG TPA: helix-hairpin-helix domain-containing protein [Anaerolineae bacterium]|nr:helix-hairpin-helix domain-containing protein [Anaerolineae bacterium]
MLLALVIGLVLAVAGLALLIWLLWRLWTRGERDKEPPIVEFELEPEPAREPESRQTERLSTAFEEMSPVPPTVGGPEAISPAVSEPILEPEEMGEPWVETLPVEEEPFLAEEGGLVTGVEDLIVEEPAAQAPLPGAADDLKLIEGIGPKIAAVLREAGIGTFAQLAATNVDRLEAILREADPRLLRLAAPGTWPEQARLAAVGEWDALTELQGRLRGGRQGL